jgi:hypothetical protein
MASTMTPTAGASMFLFPTPTTQPGSDSDWNKSSTNGAKSLKLMENPLITRSPPTPGGVLSPPATFGTFAGSSMLRNGLPSSSSPSLALVTTTGGGRSSSIISRSDPSEHRSPLSPVLHNMDGLRRRKGGAASFASNDTGRGFAPPPKATLSLQGHMLHEVREQPTVNDVVYLLSVALGVLVVFFCLATSLRMCFIRNVFILLFL